MRLLLRVLLIVLVVLLVVGLLGLGVGYTTIRRPWPRIRGNVRVDGLEGEVTIIRDSWGVPHIYASNTHDLFFAQGYVHAQDRFWQMEFSRRTGSGRLAEILGPSALSNDRFIRTVGWHRTAAEEFDLLDDEVRAVLEAYAEGVNAYISSRRGRLGLEFTVLGLNGVRFDPEPWTPYDTLTWAKVMAWNLGGNRNAELLRAAIAARLGSDAVAVLVPPYPADNPIIVPQPLLTPTLSTVPPEAFASYVFGSSEGIGSNNWVVAGSRTETGMPLLANDPHLGIQMPAIWYEVGLHCEPRNAACPYNVVGVSFPGSPGVIIGHNERIAWGVTNLGPDVQDLFIERVNPENPNQVEFQGQWEDMQIIREEIAVAGQEEPVVVNVRVTRHGPIINDIAGGVEQAWSFGWQPLAFSWTALEHGTITRSILLLNRASNWNEFRRALAYWDAPGQNFVYADVEGNIGYQATGRIPIRAAGDGTMPVPGWSGEYEWIGTIPFNELPYAFNPPQGYIVTANNAVVGPDYPYFLSADWDSGYRARRIVDMIEADPSLSIADMQAMQGDSMALWAQDVLPYILPLPATCPMCSQNEQERLLEAMELLRAWDGRSTRDSVGAAIFNALSIHLIDLTFGDELGADLLTRARTTLTLPLVNILPEQSSPWFDNIRTPAVETRDEIIMQALLDTIDELTERLGPDMSRWQWGELHTATFQGQGLGQSGIRPIEAIFNRGPVPVDGAGGAVNNTAFRLDDPYAVGTVPSYRQIVDLGDWSRSLSMHTTGQSGHAFHRHYDDMIDPWRNIEYHPMLWQRADVEADAEGVLLLRP